MGTETGLDAALAVDSVDIVVVTDTEHLGHDGMRELAWALEEYDVDLLVAPNVVDVAGPRVHLEAHGNMPLIYLSGPAYSRARTIRREMFDRCFAALVLVAASPVLLVAALAIRLTSKGPVFYRSERIGAHGVPFEMFKFRTMVLDADQVREELVKHNIGAGPLFKIRNDPRVTPVGRLLRRFSIDEIPQFYNVLRGDMSVVGPRPPLRAEVDTYDETVMRRLLVKQGITGSVAGQRPIGLVMGRLGPARHRLRRELVHAARPADHPADGAGGACPRRRLLTHHVSSAGCFDLALRCRTMTGVR